MDSWGSRPGVFKCFNVTKYEAVNLTKTLSDKKLTVCRGTSGESDL